MKIMLLSAFALAGLLIACNQSSKKHGSDPAPGNISESLTCYSYINNRDTVQMRIIVKDNMVTGELVYQLDEKDKNRGTFLGRINGDTLFADYKFLSEGYESVRQIAFLKKENSFVEGYGEIEEHDGKMQFKSRNNLNFNSQIVLQRDNCPE